MFSPQFHSVFQVTSSQVLHSPVTSVISWSLQCLWLCRSLMSILLLFSLLTGMCYCPNFIKGEIWCTKNNFQTDFQFSKYLLNQKSLCSQRTTHVNPNDIYLESTCCCCFSHDNTLKCLRTPWRTESKATKHNFHLQTCLRKIASIA